MSSNPVYTMNLSKEQKQSLASFVSAPNHPKDSSLQKRANEVVRRAIENFVAYDGKAADVAKLEEFVIAQFEEARNSETGRLSPVQDEILAMAKEKVDALFAQAAGVDLVKGKPSFLR